MNGYAMGAGGGGKQGALWSMWKWLILKNEKTLGTKSEKIHNQVQSLKVAHFLKRLSYLKVTEKCGSPAPAWRFNPLKCSAAASLYLSRAAPGGYSALQKCTLVELIMGCC